MLAFRFLINYFYIETIRQRTMKNTKISITCPDCGKVIELDVVKAAASLMGKSGGSSTSEAKKKSSAENGRKYGGRPKGSKNKAPRSDIGKKRGPRTMKEDQ